MRGIRLGLLAGVAGLACWAAIAAPDPQAPLPGQDRPLPQIPIPPKLDFSIQAPRRSPVPRAVEDLEFDIRDVRIVGAQHYRPEVLRPLVTPVVGKKIHLADLIACAEQIETRYHNDGYVLTRAFVPTQSVNDGVFQITVVEGYVSAVAVQGGSDTARRAVEQRLGKVTEARPLKLSVLEEALLSSNELPGVTAKGLLRPSPTEEGASEMVVTIEETPATGSISADNSGSGTTGRWTVAAEASAHSPLGDGGQVTLDASANPASPQTRYSVSGRYVAPVPFLEGLTYTLSALDSHGQPGGTVSALSLITNSTAFGARIATPLIVSRENKLSVDGGLTIQSADVTSHGNPTTHDEWRVLDLALTYQNVGWAGGVTNVTADVARGIHGLGAKPSHDATLSNVNAPTDFTKFSGQVRRTQSIDGPLSAQISINGQISPTQLITGEKISFGGPAVGRGYDPGSISGDLGVGAANELRYDLDAAWLGLDTAQIYAFYDAGKVWNHAVAVPHGFITSTGGGLRGTILTDVSFGVQVSQALLSVPGNEVGKKNMRVIVNTSIRF